MFRLPVLLSLVLWAPTASAGGPTLSREEFRMYRYYLNALEHPEVRRMKPSMRTPAIARDGRFKLKELEAAIAKGSTEGDVQSRCETAVRTALEAGPLAGRLGRVEADVRDPHAVLYVQWFNEDLAQVEEEAALAVAQAVRACPLVSTIQVWAQAKAHPTARVFQGLISGQRAERFRTVDVADFADTRYLRAFEQVKHAGRGDDLSDETSDPKVERPSRG
ncbi:MAG: hypothetical protein L0Y66_07100 [Myxococcaceae bacterium]|nr:hypothetical protein [Myxococcaceae bacterium]MCI0669743.1 hypothetical protein [Myxococcaceae bacterium]